MKQLMLRRVAAAMICTTVILSFTHADDGLWLDSRVKPLPTDKLGPFVRTSDGAILAIDTTASYVSTDEGRTWSAGRPLFSGQHSIRVSNERAVFRTRDGVIIAAFMNLAERHWTWSDQLGDAPEARLPTYVMRSLDDGRTWQDIQKMHEDWSGAVRDMIQTADGRIIFTAMKMRHNPGRHSVLSYSSTDDGKTWTASNLIDLGGAGHHGGVTEPTLTELPDGRVWMLIRTNWGEFWSAYSHDGGQFWRVIQPSGIPASSAPGLLKRLTTLGGDDAVHSDRSARHSTAGPPVRLTALGGDDAVRSDRSPRHSLPGPPGRLTDVGGDDDSRSDRSARHSPPGPPGRLVLVWNRLYPDGKSEWPLSGGDNRWSATPVSNHREELSMAFSDDDGKAWGKPVVIAHRRDTNATGSARWVAYPYVFEASPGELWITTMQGGLRVKLRVSDFVDKQD
ncbi:MAG TPA: exo-alpha-sialidase [Planctomycetes bacterium]|nr:exo-alpha-sialidase [Planctomycetota bacterium]